MKRRLLYSTQVVLFGLLNLSLLATILQFSGKSNPLTKLDGSKPVYNHTEAFNPALSRLNSLGRLEEYCDSMYAEAVIKDNSVEFEKTYVDIVSEAVRNRFYHGYSSYSFSNNYVAMVISKATITGLSAPVMPDDILKFPYAACSQQAIVMMEVLKHKGFTTRKIAFNGKKFGGHFAFEVWYDNAWHFNDPNMEPDKQVLDQFGRPDVDFLAHNQNVLLQAYHQYPAEEITDIFTSYTHGTINQFPAKRAALFQKATHFLSYSAWLFILVAFIIVRRSYLRTVRSYALGGKVSRMSEHQSSSVYYPDYKTQGA